MTLQQLIKDTDQLKTLLGDQGMSLVQMSLTPPHLRPREDMSLEEIENLVLQLRARYVLIRHLEPYYFDFIANDVRRAIFNKVGFNDSKSRVQKECFHGKDLTYLECPSYFSEIIDQLLNQYNLRKRLFSQVQVLIPW